MTEPADEPRPAGADRPPQTLSWTAWANPAAARPPRARPPVDGAGSSLDHGPARWPADGPARASAADPAALESQGPASAPADHPVLAPSPGGEPWRPGATTAVRGGGRRGVPGVVVALLVLVALLAGVVVGAVGARSLFGLPGATVATLPTAAPGGRAPGSVAEIAEVVLTSTVSIEASADGQLSSGSGVVLRADGYVVTNNHVVAPAADGGQVVVVFADGSQEEAEVVGRTADYDLAVLKVDRTDLAPLVLADSDTVVVGDPVVAVGAPLGLDGTVTTGIVSALDRPVRAGGEGATTFINAIQTDAAINPGNSGGPLLDAAGQVVGINTAIAQAAGTSQATGSIGLGFAIPANQVRRTTEQLIATGRATYPVIGVGLDVRYTGEGVRVLADDGGGTPAVVPGGPGDQAGIEPGDVIVAIDGRPVTDPDELVVAIRARAPGETVVLTVRRDGGERDVAVVLGEESS